MLIQGSIMAYLYAQVPEAGRSIGHAVFFAWLVGGILVSYEALAEAGKYNVPAVGSWIAVELGAGLFQVTLFGGLLGLVALARVAPTRERPVCRAERAHNRHYPSKGSA